MCTLFWLYGINKTKVYQLAHKSTSPQINWPKNQLAHKSTIALLSLNHVCMKTKIKHVASFTN